MCCKGLMGVIDIRRVLIKHLELIGGAQLRNHVESGKKPKQKMWGLSIKYASSSKHRSHLGFGPGLGFWKARARGSGPGFQIRNAAGKCTIIPSSRLVDLNNSATLELTSHKYIQQIVQPVGTAPSTKTCPKRSAMDADWSLTSDIKDSDGNGKQMKVKHLQRSCDVPHDLGIMQNMYMTYYPTYT
ncbi:hypothetical protein BDR03DRAFT_987687 [Suillus americanus]|nr:hypothetical protein BDR03DRAFT_987687 [Suillus americanus]